MRYDFPADITIDEVRVAIANANARFANTIIDDETGKERVVVPKFFIEADRGDHVIFNYLVAFDGSFPFPNTGDAALDREYAILRECRGMVFHKDGRLLNRKYAKFFNIGEKPETQINVIDFSEPHEILEKLDGSMITPMFLGDYDDMEPDDVRWCTKMGITGVAEPVEAWVKDHPNYARWAALCLYSGMTPIFEWCSRKQRIVIDYPEDRLVLTGIRNNRTGAYLPRSAMLAAERHDIEIVVALPGSVENIEHFMNETHDLLGAEGYIIRFADGRMYKVKGAWYCQIHKTKELIAREKDVVALIAHNLLDDAKTFMDDDDRAAVERFHEAYELGVAVKAAELQAIADDLIAQANGDKKLYASLVAERKLGDMVPGILFGAQGGKDIAEQIRRAITKYAHPTAGTQARIDAIRFMYGGIYWDDYRYMGASADE